MFALGPPIAQASASALGPHVNYLKETIGFLRQASALGPLVA